MSGLSSLYKTIVRSLLECPHKKDLCSDYQNEAEIMNKECIFPNYLDCNTRALERMRRKLNTDHSCYRGC